MKNLGKILSAAVLSAGLFFAPVKAKADELNPYLEIGLNANMAIGGFSVNYIPDSINNDSSGKPYSLHGLGTGGLIDAGLRARLGIEYTPTDWLDIKAGIQGNFSFNTDLTGGTDGYFCLLSKTPIFSVNPGAFVRTSFFDKTLFVEYAATFFNEISVLTGIRNFKIDGTPGNPDPVTESRHITGSYPLGYSFNHIISAGIHFPLSENKTSALELYAGVCIPQIINQTSLGTEMGLSSSPTFTVGAKVLLETPNN